MVPRFHSKSPCFHSQAFTLIVQSVNALRKAGEAVKAKNKKLLRRRCAHAHACARESAFTQWKGGHAGTGSRSQPEGEKERKHNATTPAVPKWERRGLFGRGCRQAAVREGIPHRGEVTPVPRCGRCTVREAGDIGGILRSPFRALPSNGGDRWAVGSR